MAVKLKIYLPGSDGPTVVDFPGADQVGDIIFRQLAVGPLFTHASKVVGIPPGANYWELIVDDDGTKTTGARTSLNITRVEILELKRILGNLEFGDDPAREIVVDRISRTVELALAKFKEPS